MELGEHRIHAVSSLRHNHVVAVAPHVLEEVGEAPCSLIMRGWEGVEKRQSHCGLHGPGRPSFLQQLRTCRTAAFVILRVTNDTDASWRTLKIDINLVGVEVICPMRSSSLGLESRPIKAQVSSPPKIIGWKCVSAQTKQHPHRILNTMPD